MIGEVSALFSTFDIGWEAMKILAIVGGIATGGLASGWLLRLFGKMATGRKMPTPAVATVRGLGGVGAGVAVWFWVYGSGGGGPGQGGFWGPGQEGVQAPGLLDSKTTKSSPGSEGPAGQIAKVPEKSEGTTTETLRIDLLGGARVRDGRFYRMEGEKESLALADLRTRLEQRRWQKAGPRLKAIELVIYLNSVAEDHAAVRDLRSWAQENDLEVKVISLDRELP
jgi:hypothetical protein